MKETVLNFLKRYSILVVAFLIATILAKLEQPEVRTILLASLLECFAIAFSSFASFVFTKVQFSEKPETPNLGLIFLGVHICFGFFVLALYLAQYAN
ncbi:MAG: hypothetical protein CH6_4515 [Candidatus Kapaibacterium sp.]|nr:MAG: hypothetical protein CH6_4515 [Candidatus Kapabacteria bacterium]